LGELVAEDGGAGTAGKKAQLDGVSIVFGGALVDTAHQVD
jgi:hypothetical protein